MKVSFVGEEFEFHLKVQFQSKTSEKTKRNGEKFEFLDTLFFFSKVLRFEFCPKRAPVVLVKGAGSAEGVGGA